MATRIHLAGLAALTLLIGCSDDSAVDAKETQAAPRGAPGVSSEDFAARAKRLGAEAKELFGDALEKGIQQADTKLADLRARYGPEMEKAGEATRERWKALEQDLEAARAEAANKLAELRAATGERFEEAKAGFQAAKERLEELVAQARKQLDER